MPFRLRTYTDTDNFTIFLIPFVIGKLVPLTLHLYLSLFLKLTVFFFCGGKMVTADEKVREEFRDMV